MTSGEARSGSGRDKFEVYARQLEESNWSPTRVIGEQPPSLAGRVKIERMLIPKPLRHRVKTAVSRGGATAGTTPSRRPPGIRGRSETSLGMWL